VADPGARPTALAYIDQASFLGLRALGRGPLVQFSWIYERPVDLDGLRRLHRNLGGGLLGRLIERSVVPFGRHHWVAWAGPADLEIGEGLRPRDQATAWLDEQIALPIDPEYGPAWRLAVQPLTGGGAAVTLIASHAVCDGLGLGLAVAQAVQGANRDLGYPPPRARTRRQAWRQDIREVLRAVPDMVRAAVAAVRLAGRNTDDFSSSVARSASPKNLRDSRPVTIPALAVFIDDEQWDSRAESLGGTSNSLFAGVAARLAQRTGRVDDRGQVKLSFPVSERTEGDTRANALTAMMLTVDPTGVTESLAGVRAEIKRNLTELSATRYELLAPLPLTPLVPQRLARKLEGMALGSGSPAGCSNLGPLDPAVNRPDGSDADYFWMRQMESQITPDILDRLGGTLYLASGRLHGQVFVAVSGWQTGGLNSTRRLADLVTRTLDDFGLSGTLEATMTSQ
jgi:diacylglycerol O-acyltransferase